MNRLVTWQQESMFQRLVKQPSLAPRLTLSKAILYILATLVHLSTLFYLVAGVYLLLTGSHYFWGLVGGVFFLMLAWVLRPRFPVPDDEPVFRNESPTLFNLIDRVAAELKVLPPQLVTYNYIHNASFGRVGLSRRSWMNLGMHLWMNLSPEARIALIAHELAHDANNDAARGFWIENAFESVRTWYILIVPYLNLPKSVTIFYMISHFWEMLGYMFFYTLSLPIYGLIWVFISLGMYDSRRAEYLADELASRVVGTRAVINLHRHMPANYELKDVNPLLFSHPTSDYRIRFLEERPVHYGNVHTSDAEMRQIDGELAKIYQKARREFDKPKVDDNYIDWTCITN